jgi:hypothetical protein
MASTKRTGFFGVFPLVPSAVVLRSEKLLGQVQCESKTDSLMETHALFLGADRTTLIRIKIQRK